MELDITEFCQSGAIFSFNHDDLIIGSGEAKWKKFSDLDISLPAFYFPDFFLEMESPWLQFQKNYELKIDDFQKNIQPPAPSKKPEWQNSYKSLFLKNFEILKRSFINETLMKAVPYAFSHSKETMLHDQLLYSINRGLAYSRNFPIHLYGFWQNGEGLLGGTPELLFTYDFLTSPFQLKTCALAGTQGQKISSIDFKKKNKEMMEHQFVIDGIRETLNDLGKVNINHTEVLHFPRLTHLLTPIEIDLFQEESFENIVQTLHPTPALGAYPKKEGAAWLKAYQELVPRERFGAPVGLLLPFQKRAKCVVGIRNVQWSKDGMAIGAGCGVIKESDAESEWNEINLKMNSIKELLGL